MSEPPAFGATVGPEVPTPIKGLASAVGGNGGGRGANHSPVDVSRARFMGLITIVLGVSAGLAFVAAFASFSRGQQEPRRTSVGATSESNGDLVSVLPGTTATADPEGFGGTGAHGHGEGPGLTRIPRSPIVLS